MDDKRWIQLAEKAMTDPTILPVEITIRDAWFLVAALQLAWKHPGQNAARRKWLRALADAFSGRIVELHPEAKAAIDHGWRT